MSVLPETLTARQREFLDFLVSYQNEHGSMPTMRQIAMAMQIGSTNGVVSHINHLRRKGYLECEQFTSRGLSLTARALKLYPVVRVEFGTVRLNPLCLPREMTAEATRKLAEDLLQAAQQAEEGEQP